MAGLLEVPSSSAEMPDRGRHTAPGVRLAATSGKVVRATGLYDDASNSVGRSRRWISQPTKAALGGTLSTLAAPGHAQLRFKGSGAAWLARTSPYDGIARVYLDGKLVKKVDLYSARTQYQQVVYRVTGLKPGSHILRITRSGTKNRKSAGRNVTLDAFRVLDTVAPKPPAQVTATPGRTGAEVAWTPSPDRDVVRYDLFREVSGRVQRVGSTTATRFSDVGLAAGSRHDFWVTATDASGNSSASSARAGFTMPVTLPSADDYYAGCPAPTVLVHNRGELLAALATAGPGTVIEAAPGRYPGQVNVTVTGSPDAPVWICGPRTAVFDGGGVDHNAGLRIDSSSHLVVAGMTVRNSQKGISVLASRSIILADNRVEHIGDEGIHLKGDTIDSVVVGNSVDSTGLMTPAYGEGIYVGTDQSHWCTPSGCTTDRSDRNTVVGNEVTRTAAEPIEVKEGTSDGLIRDNVLDGSGAAPGVGRLIALKGRRWVVEGNRGRDSGLDGVQILAKAPGYGQDNILYDNRFSGDMTGYAVRVPTEDLGNIVGCDNVAARGARAVSNQNCQQ